MKAMINGKEVDLTETAVVFYEGITFDTIDARLENCRLEMKCTDEGLIVDVWAKMPDGEEQCVGTFGATAQELADDFCH